MTRQAGLYCRISHDQAGEGLGVERQRRECEALASELGWTVAAVHTDNDISAYTGKARPGYLALLEDLKQGRVDAVLAWHPDRLYRHPTDLETLINTVEAAGAAVRTVRAGELDLNTGSGRMVARMLGAAARGEVDRTIERVQSKKREIREAGRWPGGARPFCYRLTPGEGRNPSALVIDQREAEALRSGAAAVIAGQSTLSVAREWNAAGILTSRNEQWTAHQVARVLARPRNAALMEHYGAVVGPASWEPIYDEATWEGVRAVLGDGISPKRTQRPRVKMLLSGVARCGYPVDGGICGQTIMGAGSNASGRRYRCSTGKHIARIAADLDQHVTDVVLERLADPDTLSLVAADRESAAELYAQADAIRARMTGLGEDYADGLIDRETMRAGTERAKTRLADVDERLSALTAGSALDGLAGRGDAAERWTDLSMDRKRAVVDALMVIIVNPGKRGGTGGTRFNPESVTIQPRRP